MATKFKKLNKSQLAIIANVSGQFSKKELIKLATEKINQRILSAIAF